MLLWFSQKIHKCNTKPLNHCLKEVTCWINRVDCEVEPVVEVLICGSINPGYFLFLFFSNRLVSTYKLESLHEKWKKKQKKKNITFSAQELFSSKALNNCNSMYGIGNLASNFLFSAIQDGDFHKKNSWLYWTAVILHLPIKFPQMYAFLRKCHRKRTQEKNWLTRCDYQAQRVIAKKAR